MSHRLPPRPGEWIERDRPLSFEFEGVHCEAFAGDVVSSALLAGGIRTQGRSFKYHRARAPYSMANHDANVLLAARDGTNLRGDVTGVVAGERYRAVNTLGGVRLDAGRALALLGRALPVGFYYKAFYRPRRLFPAWEWLIRRLAGLGRIDAAWRGGRLPRRVRHCDVLVVGAGAAGLAAARALAGSGLAVVVADENARPGGALGYRHAGDAAAQAFLAETLDAVAAAPNITLMTGTSAAGVYDRYAVPLVGAEGITLVQTRALVVASGVIEQPAVFANNDLPGVMLASGAQRLVHRYAVAPAERAVVWSANAEGYAAAIDLADAGIEIAALLDAGRPAPGDAAVQALLERGIALVPDARVRAARASRGELAGVVVETGSTGHRQVIDCDGLFTSVGWTPAAALALQAGVRFAYDATVQQTVPAAPPERVVLAGQVNGVFGWRERAADGRAAAHELAAALGAALEGPAPRPGRAQEAHSHPYPLDDAARRGFIDFDEDLSPHDLDVGIREGFDSVQLLKRYSTIGMGPSQGKLSNMNGVRYLARHQGRDVDAVGTTTTRPFWQPVTMGALAGRRLRRERMTPLHAFHVAAGADMMDAGPWRRPRSYAAGSPRAAVEAEARTVRESAGLIDVSTLGKIELFGPDAEALLSHAYTCTFERLREGMTRYVFMVDGSGTLVDDGVVAHLGAGHYYLTATTTHAPQVVRQLELHAVQLGLDVAIVDRTAQLAALNLAGPRARDILAGVTTEDLDDPAFPYLAAREAEVAGVAARLLRVGFVGELGYEIHCPAGAAAGVWQALLDAGAAHGCRPFGVEAQRLLRLEKGHLIVGQDTDGTTNPYEVGLGWGVRLDKAHFHGRHSLSVLSGRVSRRLVGFRMDAAAADSVRECHLVIEGGRIAGRVTSVAYSPTLEVTVGLAMMVADLGEPGRRFTIRVDGHLVSAEVVPLPFYDPDNLRQRASDAAVESAA